MKRIVTLTVLLATACGGSEEPLDVTLPTNVSEAPSEGLSPVQPEFAIIPLRAETDSDRAIERMRGVLDFYERRFGESSAWLDLASAAQVHLGIARLNGDVGEYVVAGAQLGHAFDAAPEGTGPFLERASYHMTVHEVGKVDADLDSFSSRLLLRDSDRAAIEGLRGDVAFHHGDLTSALAHFEAAEALDPSVASAGRLANYMLKTGDYDAAAELYRVASDRVDPIDPGARAWAELHRGIVELERNDTAAALPFYEEANRRFGGWFLVEEHIAEAHLLLGDPERALEIYRSVLARVPNGEFYAALGDTYVELGDEARARTAYARARNAFDRDLSQLPSAASGHALDFFLAHDRPRALELARANFDLRPGYEARTKLAQALLANARLTEAIEVLEPALDSEWATVDYLATVALVFAHADPALAAQYRERAEAIAPGAVDELAGTLGLP